MKTKPDRKSRHKALLRDVGKLIGQPADSLAVRLVALARLKMDATEAQLLSGDPAVTVQDITALEEVFAKYVPKPGMNLKVSFVDSARGKFKCTKCGELNEVQDDAPVAEKPVQPVPPQPRSMVDHIPGAGSIRTGRTPPTLVAIPRRDPGSIHSAVALVPDGNGSFVETHPPLKRNQPREAWEGYRAKIPAV